MYYEHIAVAGVTCHTCQKWLRKGCVYFKREWSEGAYNKYQNYCPECMKKIAHREVTDMLNTLEVAKKEEDKQKKENETICSKCKNRYKNVVGECSPTQRGCKPKYDTAESKKK